MTEPVEQRLRRAAQSCSAEPVSMRTLALAHGPAGQGSLLLLMSVLCLLPVPGTGTLLGLGIGALAASMWRGDRAAKLPRRVAQLQLTSRWARRVLALLASMYAFAAGFARPRLSKLTVARPRSWTAATVGLMAGVVVLPIPFGNVLPALALILIGLGLVFRDGVALILGLALAGLALVVTAGLLTMAGGLGAEWLMSRGAL